MTMQIRALGQTPADPTSLKASNRGAPVRALAQALRTGDLGAASEAYAAMAAKAPDRAARNPDGAFAQLGAALQAGDLAAARSAFGSVFTGHLPRNGGVPPAVPGGGTAPAVASARSGPGGLLDVTA